YHSCTPCHTVLPPHPQPTLFPYTTLFRSRAHAACCAARGEYPAFGSCARVCPRSHDHHTDPSAVSARARHPLFNDCQARAETALDRKSTRLNSSHRTISYAVFCLKKKKNN